MSRAKYSSDDDRVLVKTLIVQARAGNQSENGFKGCAYSAAVEALAGSEDVSGGKPKTATSCRDHFIALKKDYFTVKALRELSGFGWDDESSLVTAPDDVWERYLKAHPNAKKWRKTPFPLFDDIGSLVEGTAATGEGAYHPGHSVPSPVIPDFDDGSATSPSSTPPPPSQSAVSLGRKRAASHSPGPTARARKRNGKVTAADSVGVLVRAVGNMTDALLEPPEHTSSMLAPSPKRRRDAIRALASDGAVDLTPRRKVKLITRFRKDTSAADTYMALNDDDVLRKGFLEVELEDDATGLL